MVIADDVRDNTERSLQPGRKLADIKRLRAQNTLHRTCHHNRPVQPRTDHTVRVCAEGVPKGAGEKVKALLKEALALARRRPVYFRSRCFALQLSLVYA
eukprot:1179671-Prorocentrum_minimum.AAC.3